MNPSKKKKKQKNSSLYEEGSLTMTMKDFYSVLSYWPQYWPKYPVYYFNRSNLCEKASLEYYRILDHDKATLPYYWFVKLLSINEKILIRG